MAERKRFIDVKIPSIEGEIRVLGTAQELHNKTIKLDLTRKMKGKGLNIKFRIFNKEGELIAVPNKLELLKSYIRRIMRKRVDYVEDSFKTTCLDLRVIVKPFLITRKKVSRAVRKNLRNTTKEFIVEYCKERKYEEVVQDIIDGNLQKALLPKLKKVYPLSFCDIRIFETKDIEKINLEELLVKETKKDKKESEEESEESIEEEKPKSTRKKVSKKEVEEDEDKKE